jgi:Fe2+ or Zn2+ uptake regulation protein
MEVMPNSSSKTASEWLKCLQENGYRLTAPRQAVVEIIAYSQNVLSLDVCSYYPLTWMST